jgi:hypothetical protein
MVSQPQAAAERQLFRQTNGSLVEHVTSLKAWVEWANQRNSSTQAVTKTARSFVSI